MQQRQLILVYPNQFGYHTDSYKYCQYLSGIFQISYICFDQGFEKIELKGVNVVYVPYHIGKLKRLVNYYRTVFRISRQQPNNILFTIQFKFSFLIGVFGHSDKKILDYRTGDLSANWLKRWFLNRLMWFDSLFYSKISVISEGLKNKLWLGKNAVVLPLGADSMAFNRHLYTKLNLLYVGALDSRNIHETIEGVALFVKRNPQLKEEIRYTIIGFGRPQIENQIKDIIIKNNLEQQIAFIGRKRLTELPFYFEECNIGVSYIPITPFYQFQPATKTFEYIISGLFTIATNTFENRNIINHDNGILCNDNAKSFADSLDFVHAHLDKIDEDKIRNSLNNYTWNSIVKNILEPFLLA